MLARHEVYPQQAQPQLVVVRIYLIRSSNIQNILRQITDALQSLRTHAPGMVAAMLEPLVGQSELVSNAAAWPTGWHHGYATPTH